MAVSSIGALFAIIGIVITVERSPQLGAKPAGAANDDFQMIDHALVCYDGNTRMADGCNAAAIRYFFITAF